MIANSPDHCLASELAGPDATIYFQNYPLFWRVLIRPDLAIGEVYMDGRQ
jgi:hypothetical protein